MNKLTGLLTMLQLSVLKFLKVNNVHVLPFSVPVITSNRMVSSAINDKFDEG